MSLFTGVTQELIDETRLGIENVMLADLKKLSADKGDLGYRGPNSETLVRISLDHIMEV